MSRGPDSALRYSAGAEARFFFGQVQAGRMLLESAREAIAGPDYVLVTWREAARDDADLCELFTGATRFREAVASEFEALLAREE